MELKSLKQNKRGMGMIGGIIAGVGGLVILTILVFVVVGTITDADLLTPNTENANVTARMVANLTEGVDNVATKIPTVLLIAAVVLLFGALAVLVQRSRQATSMGGGGSL